MGAYNCRGNCDCAGGSIIPLRSCRVFQYCRDKLFCFAIAAYAINRWLLKPALPPEEVFFRCYFNDVLLLPCALPLALQLHKLFGVRKHDLPPTLIEVVLHLCIWSVILELVSPHLFARSTADAVDVAAYATGGFASWLFWKVSVSRDSHRLENDMGSAKPNNAVGYVANAMTRAVLNKLEKNR